MRLDQLLVHKKIVDSRTEAQELIASGFVLVNGEQITKTTRQFEDTAHLEVVHRRKYVGRGGEKLEGVLFNIFKQEENICAYIKNVKALDIGSSTGGFTQCLLMYGASHVDAVDVGTNQFHESLRADPRISLYEKTDIRDFVGNSPYDVIVGDVSFIPLKHILDTVFTFGNESTLYVLLIKPQFEVGRGNTKKGIVKDSEYVDEILRGYTEDVLRRGFLYVNIFPCVLRGGDGNQEYFIVIRKSSF